MKFDLVIGNPPYQDESASEAKTTEELKKTLPPLYNHFMDSAYQISDKALLIHPARFLYNAGNTPKAWNKHILNDPSFKIIYHAPDSSQIFNAQSIMGGIVISYRDTNKCFGAIRQYSKYPELASIIKKVINDTFLSFAQIVYSQGLYRFSPQIYHDHPTLMKKFADPRITAGAFVRAPQLFTEEKPHNKYSYSLFLGLFATKRVWRWFRNDYFIQTANFANYKVIIPKANGSPALGQGKKTQLIGAPLLGLPSIAHTQSFLSIGNFTTQAEAQACLKYIKTKFCRAMLGTLKITQNNPPPIWTNVPLQDFSAASYLDWSSTIPEIDAQLYKKYRLTKSEIGFIENNVKEME